MWALYLIAFFAGLVGLVGLVVLFTHFMIVQPYQAISSHLANPQAGVESFVGQIAEATTALNPEGTVFFRGSYWKAESAIPIQKGEEVRIMAVKGLQLIVEPVAAAVPVSAT